MGFFGLIKKRFKKRLRLKRRWLALGMLALAAGLAFLYASASGSGDGEPRRLGDALSVFAPGGKPPASPSELTREASVTLRRLYVCGEDERALGVMPPENIAKLAADHPEWEFYAVAADKVVFTEHIDDLSDACKENSYIGVDAGGNLTLFRGPPREERAVKTFFQLNIEHLESSLPGEVVQQLRDGIKITDIADYNSVLSTFSDYAIDETEKVMKPGA
ncbi:BofC C-terminal domain-containing protein [Paenibacillus sp.]|uniref:BofC C-terminal domain-containing protein n=1 Tax=Paenibacillus sp. TaxID=58172 RepID=UPI002D72BABC|nr:BofC C-terminal domain-containing protein [Paenibacillus sp.]HZG87022.1 BofC C-terminal domain-containing protein [Paenibacillus sp.]